MNQLDQTAESLEDVLTSLNNDWQSAQDVWLDANCSEFESSFWVEIDDVIRKTLDDFRRFLEAAERAQQNLES